MEQGKGCEAREGSRYETKKKPVKEFIQAEDRRKLRVVCVQQKKYTDVTDYVAGI